MLFREGGIQNSVHIHNGIQAMPSSDFSRGIGALKIA